MSQGCNFIFFDMLAILRVSAAKMVVSLLAISSRVSKHRQYTIHKECQPRQYWLGQRVLETSGGSIRGVSRIEVARFLSGSSRVTILYWRGPPWLERRDLHNERTGRPFCQPTTGG